jgi:hypothetical protein
MQDDLESVTPIQISQSNHFVSLLYSINYEIERVQSIYKEHMDSIINNIKYANSFLNIHCFYADCTWLLLL